MAFVSLIMAFIFIFLLILGAVFMLGAIITIVSLIRRKKAAKRGEKPKRVGLITGIIIMLLPILTFLGIILFFMFGDKSDSYEKATSCRDSITAGIENDDAEIIYSAFSQNTQAADTGLMSEIEGVLEFIDGNVESYRAVLPSENCEKYDEDGMFEIMNFHGDVYNIKTDKGNEYILYYFGYSQDDDHPERLGLDYIRVKDGNGSAEAGIAQE